MLALEDNGFTIRLDEPLNREHLGIWCHGTNLTSKTSLEKGVEIAWLRLFLFLFYFLLIVSVDVCFVRYFNDEIPTPTDLRTLDIRHLYHYDSGLCIRA